PQAGEKVTVTMRLQTREGYEIKDPRDYEGLRVRSELTGDGFSPQTINLTDNGERVDPTAADGRFTGTVMIPESADGAMNVGVTLTAPGLRTDIRSERGQVSSNAPAITAALEVPRAKGHPGGKIAANLAVSNTTDTPRTLRLSITDVLPGLLSVTPEELKVQPGERGTRKVTLQVASADAFGERLGDGLELAGTFTLADVTDYDRLLVQSFLSVQIAPDPVQWDRYWSFPFTVLTAALAAAGILALLRQHKTLADPSGLVRQAAMEASVVLTGRKGRHGDNKRQSGWSWEAAEPPISARDVTPVAGHQELRPAEQTMPQPAAQGTDDGSAEPRWLVAELAEQTSPGREVPLHVQIVREGPRGTAMQMRPFHLPREGALVRITIYATDLVILDELMQELHVEPGRNSDVLLFRLKAPLPGLHQVTVRAFRNGTCLGEVTCQISVGHGSVTRDGPPRQAPLPSMAFDPGEVTLQVLKNEAAETITFQLLSETPYPPEIIHFAGGDSRQATNQIYAELKSAAKSAATNGTEKDAQRLRARLRNHGVQLWTSAVPQAVQRQFWEQAERISAFTVLGEHDIIPWELLYPLNAGHDDRGFLAEWLPVVRRVFGQDRVRSLALPGVAFVVPPGSPADASREVASLRIRLGENVADGGVLTERAALTALIEDGHAGLLHFACHNAFTGSGSCVTMADGPFDPIDLASAAQLQTLQPHRPLVFFNACRSAGEISWFGESLGWAPQFLTAGAGAFVGTLWPVRSQSALQFAEAFYDELIANGQPLGRASLVARQTIRDLHGGDPTWLAYAVYGSPAATAHTTE
ncbi:CHAT domain-containing protein, partial [Streptomyces sp. NPDC001928]|uniref:CHAT domain-containing protein n=1 Tax=Streptomyces sp. NPDC001928 TaxID=3154404 RepID=UPI0033306D6D